MLSLIKFADDSIKINRKKMKNLNIQNNRKYSSLCSSKIFSTYDIVTLKMSHAESKFTPEAEIKKLNIYQSNFLILYYCS